MLMLGLLASAPLSAQAEGAVLPVPDSASVGGPRVPRVLPPHLWTDQPRFVMARSLVLPGWGQMHNGAPIKAILLSGTTGWLIATLVEDNRTADRLRRRVNAAADAGDDEGYARAVTEYNARLDAINSHSWTLGAVVVIGMLDAYVDAHFRGFDVEFRKDPALPDGPASVPEVRVSHRWTF